MFVLFVLVALINLFAVSNQNLSRKSSSTLLFVGTYTGDTINDSKGIYAFTLNDQTSELKPLGLAIQTANPSYLLIHPTKKYVYAVDEQVNGQISAFEIDSTNIGKLKYLNKQSSRGGSPCYLSTNRNGTHLFVANYQDGTVVIFPIGTKTGYLESSTGFDQQIGSSINPDRQQSSHAHCILLDKNENNLLSANLGSDEFYRYRFLPTNGSLQRLTISKTSKAGDGPRHLVFNSKQKYLFAVNELHSTITVYRYLSYLQPLRTISTIPKNFSGINYPAEIIFHPKNEKFLYASNRGHDSIIVFHVNHQTGYLKLIQHIHTQGQTPRNFNISPNGKYLIVANQNSNNLVVFSIDSRTGKLTFTRSTAQISKPTCIKFLH